ncbi:hypothetical protein [Parabacteroides bouchesdurhonensis]|uniref:hypothetical protein n=1 Tax=Parabacteroides bouchesdurhonensis TaxID=1936995 RepID=UPI000E52077E|nr:hypothetical protein [Parabacteroides bouchesdurhonensis]RHJ94871.1 hypothetical protein DW095_00030 [Bacteroides sp. AM07-16]
MNIKGVITGDVINSTAIRVDWKKQLIDSIQDVADELTILTPLEIEFFRGDSFQLVVDKPEEALKVAILLRAGLKRKTPPESKNIWDARIALGVGEISYTSDKVVISDGEAFHFSGWGLDEIGKQKLTIRTRWENVNEELKVSTAFADDIISDWTNSQAQVIYPTLLYQTSQKDIAIEYNKTAQNISKLLGTAKENLIRMYLERYSILITRNLI